MSGLSLTFFGASLAAQGTVLRHATQTVGQQPDSLFLANDQFPEQTQEAIEQQMNNWRVLSVVPTQFLEKRNPPPKTAPMAVLWMRPRTVFATHSRASELLSAQPAGSSLPRRQHPPPVASAAPQRPSIHPILADKIKKWGIALETLKGPPAPSDDEQFARREALHPVLQKKIEKEGISLNEIPADIVRPAENVDAYLRGERTHPMLAQNISKRGIALSKESPPVSVSLEPAQGTMDPSWRLSGEERALPLPAFSANAGEHPFLVTSASIYYVNKEMPLSVLLSIFKSGEAITNGKVTLTLTLRRDAPEKPTLSLTISSFSQRDIRDFAQKMEIPILGTIKKVGDQFVFTFRQFQFRDGKTFLNILKQTLLS
ncbi:MAG: hypothetical protein Q8P84_01830 [Deltaproteobacteria bacterium]|nr:hypothetical protein [Deltaproteobacteria bacterium]